MKEEARGAEYNLFPVNSWMAAFLNSRSRTQIIFRNSRVKKSSSQKNITALNVHYTFNSWHILLRTDNCQWDLSNDILHFFNSNIFHKKAIPKKLLAPS